jgi:hypothetical protein
MVDLDQRGRLAGRTWVELAPPELEPFAEYSFVLPTKNETSEAWRVVPDLSSHILVHFRVGASGPELWRGDGVGA